MRSSSIESIQNFFAGLSTARTWPAEVRAALRALAASASHRTGVGRTFELDDLVGELLVRLCEGEFAHVDWRAASDDETRAMLHNRLHQVAVELSDGWHAYRALRAHVRAAMDEELPPAPPGPPATLYEGPRLSSRAVGLAVAWYRSKATPHRLRSVSELTRAIARDYLPRCSSLTPANDDAEQLDPADPSDAHDALEHRLDAERLHAVLAEDHPRELELLVRRYHGQGFAEIARDEGVALGTAHGRVSRSLERVGRLVRDHGFSPAAVEHCLAHGNSAG